jgi:hypothetical protein
MAAPPTSTPPSAAAVTAPVAAPARVAPKADPARCDILGCGMVATMYTTGNEVDAQGLGRPALKNLNLCERHANFAHSDDAKIFALTSDKYRQRGA